MWFQLLILVLTGGIIFYTDIKYKKIPNWVNLIILLTSIVYMIYTKVYLTHLLGGFLIGGGLLLFALITKGFGMGDVKYVMACGFLLGIRLGITGLLYGVIIGAVYGVYLVAIKKAKGKDTFAYGPSLVLGNIIAIFLEHNILGFII